MANAIEPDEATRAGVPIAPDWSATASMTAYDQLPTPVRYALASAAFDYCPVKVGRNLSKGATVAHQVTAIRQTDLHVIWAAVREDGRPTPPAPWSDPPMPQPKPRRRRTARGVSHAL